jgi:seryl-tRNA(Sec) selenium transferase
MPLTKPSLAALEEALREFENTRAQIVRNSAESNPQWRQSLVNLRRTLQDSVAKMRAALSVYENDGGNKQYCAAFAKALSSMRNAIAIHQAEWPAVSIEIENPEYNESVQRLRATANDFYTLSADLITKMRLEAPLS